MPSTALPLIDLPPRPIAISGILRVGDLAIITGPADSFKSTLALEMAWSLATGRPLLGRIPIRKRLRMGVLQNEIDPGAYKLRVEQPYTAHDDLLLCSDLDFTFDRMDELVEACDDLALDGIVLDRLGTMWPEYDVTGVPFSENEKSHVSRLLRRLKGLNRTVIMVHHDPKPSAGMRGRASGSAALINDPDTRLYLDRSVGNRVKVSISCRLLLSIGEFTGEFLETRRLVIPPDGLTSEAMRAILDTD